MKSSASDVLIIGGGLAGLVSAIDLAQAGYAVQLLEKKDYPRHKVCGEYVSNEVRPYLEELDVFPQQLAPKEITRLQISAPSGQYAETAMTMGGFGISRYALDNHLYKKAQQNGVDVLINTTAQEISFSSNMFKVKTQKGETFKAKVVIGAHGKRSGVDKALNRQFIEKKTTYVGIKHHFKADFPDDLVALHNFSGGYCGLSKVENDQINLCYLTTTKVFKQYGSIREMEEHHLSSNPQLKEFFKIAQPVFSKPLVISQINFDSKPLVENYVLMCGDAAGLIHPLCGNGMAMAIQGAKIAASAIKSYFQYHNNRSTLEQNYTESWQGALQQRLQFGRSVSHLFGRPLYSEWGVKLARWSPALLRQIVKMSHGKPLR